MNFPETTILPHRLRSLLELELQSGERITWMEQPVPGRLARQSWPIVLFGIPWTAFALAWTVGASWMTSNASGDSGMAHLFPLFGIPFVLVGVGLLSSPFWMRRLAQNTVYALTDRRAIVLATGWRGSVNVKSYLPDRLGELQRKQHADGSGDLIFSREVSRDSDGDRRVTETGFFAVRDVKGVEEMVRALAARAQTPR